MPKVASGRDDCSAAEYDQIMETATVATKVPFAFYAAQCAAARAISLAAACHCSQAFFSKTAQ